MKEIPVSDTLVRTAITPFLNPHELRVRRVPRYDLFKRMLVSTHRNALKQCILDRTLKPPHPNATWGAIDVPFDSVPEPLLLMVGWHITPIDAFRSGVRAMVEFPHISCLLLISTNASTFESDAWIIQRKSKWYRLKGWLLGGVGTLCAWFGFSYLYLTKTGLTHF